MPVGDVELPTIRATRIISDIDDKDLANFNNPGSMSVSKSLTFEDKDRDNNRSRFRIGRDKSQSQVVPYEDDHMGKSDLGFLQ